MKPLLLALLAGVLFALSLPPMNVEWLGWFALAPLLVAANGRRPLEAVGLGFFAGMLAGFVHVGWHADSTARLYGYFPYTFVASLFAAVSLGSMLLRRRWQGLPWALLVSCLGICVEWLTLFSPLPITVAITQHRFLALIQVAGITGMWGISFLLWLVNAVLADTWLSKKRRPASFAVPAALALLYLAYGAFVLSRPPAGPLVRVAAIQDHDPQETVSVVPAPAGADPPGRDTLTLRAARRGARLAVWSEGCLGASFVPGAPVNPTAALAKKLGLFLVVGYVDGAQPKSHNCAAIVSPRGHTDGVYHKIHLFGGEHLTIQPGRRARAFPTALGIMGMEICFDSCYPDITRKLARSGAQIIAVPNFDPLTYRGDLHGLHAAVLSLRAVEDRVAIVRSDPNGHSRIIGPDGRIVADEPMWTAGAAIGTVRLGDGKGTLYSRLGDWFVYLCLATLAACLLSRRSPASRKDAQDSSLRSE